MATPKDREKEAKVKELAQVIFAMHAPALAGDVEWAYRVAEKFEEISEQRWEALK